MAPVRAAGRQLVAKLKPAVRRPDGRTGVSVAFMAEYPRVESPADREPGGSRTGRPMPLPVRYAWGLLWLQGVIWGGLALLMVVGDVVAVMQILADQNAIVGLVAELLIGGLAASFAVGTILLARTLARGNEGARKTAIGVEIAMTCLGVMMTASSNFSGGLVADVGALAATTGAGLSLAAVVCLLRRSARRYFAMPGNRGGFIGEGRSRPPAEPGSASYRTAVRPVAQSLVPGLC
jgi:hypothetical protein